MPKYFNRAPSKTAHAQERQALRTQFRGKRKALTAEQQQQASHAIAERLIGEVERKLQLQQQAQPHSQQPRSPQRIAAYLANDGEVDLQPFINALWQRGIEVALPVLHPVVPNQLLFLRYHPDTEMVANRFNILEPRLRCQDIIPLSSINMLCMPLVAFDASGNRLGMGGGFYDRTLAKYHGAKYHEKTPQRLTLMGIAHDCQFAEQLPIEPWDIPITAVATPSRLWQFNADSGHD